jgi:hypothetical protein
MVHALNGGVLFPVLESAACADESQAIPRVNYMILETFTVVF